MQKKSGFFSNKGEGTKTPGGNSGAAQEEPGLENGVLWGALGGLGLTKLRSLAAWLKIPTSKKEAGELASDIWQMMKNNPMTALLVANEIANQLPDNKPVQEIKKVLTIGLDNATLDKMMGNGEVEETLTGSLADIYEQGQVALKNIDRMVDLMNGAMTPARLAEFIRRLHSVEREHLEMVEKNVG